MNQILSTELKNYGLFIHDDYVKALYFITDVRIVGIFRWS